jgi:hypothetical protein
MEGSVDRRTSPVIISLLTGSADQARIGLSSTIQSPQSTGFKKVRFRQRAFLVTASIIPQGPKIFYNAPHALWWLFFDHNRQRHTSRYDLVLTRVTCWN